MNTNVRVGRVGDVDRLYEICCAVQLRPKSERPNIEAEGFLMANYSADPSGLKEYIKKIIAEQGLTSLVAETDRDIIGWLLAYNKEAWLKNGGWSSGPDNVKWFDIEAKGLTQDDYLVLEKIAVDPNYQYRGIGTLLFADFMSGANSKMVSNVFIEVVEEVLDGQTAEDAKPIGIENKASIGFFRAMGAERVAQSINPYGYCDSYFGERGFFRDGIYLVKSSKG